MFSKHRKKIPFCPEEKWRIHSCISELAGERPAESEGVTYSKLFAWKLEDMLMPEGSYTMIKVGEGTGGGMMKQHPMPGAPSPVGALRAGGRSRRFHAKSKISWRQNHQGRYRNPWHGFV